MPQKERLKSYLLILISGIIIIISSFYIFQEKDEFIEPTPVFIQNFTIYTSKEISLEEKYIFNENTGSSEINHFIRTLNSKQLKDIENLEITINPKDKNISIKSLDENIDLKEIYMNLKNELQSNKGYYHSLLNQLEYDFVGEVKNILYDSEKNEITIQSSHPEYLDLRFLNIPCLFIENKDSSNFILENYKNQDIKYGIIFKPEAVFGQSFSEKGLLALNDIYSSESFIWKNENNGIYQKINFNDLIKTYSEKIVFTQEELVFKTLNNKNNDSLNIFIETELEKLKDIIKEFFLNYGYSVNFVKERDTSDIVLNYTWFYSENLQSSFNESLNTSITEYLSNSSNPENIFFLFRSGWNIEKNLIVKNS